MFNRVTVDGCFAGADGNLDWVVPEPELDRAALSRMPESDRILFGRKTYQMFESFWRNFDASAGSNPHGPTSDAMAPVARWINDASKIVFSRTLGEVTWRNTRLLRELDRDVIDSIKSQGGKDIMIFGSGSIVSQLTERRLIDEYQFVVSPLLLGNGRPLFKDIAQGTTLKLVEAKAFDSGNVLLRYALAN
jgi:dihydrofolate reductase